MVVAMADTSEIKIAPIGLARPTSWDFVLFELSIYSEKTLYEQESEIMLHVVQHFLKRRGREDHSGVLTSERLLQLRNAFYCSAFVIHSQK